MFGEIRLLSATLSLPSRSFIQIHSFMADWTQKRLLPNCGSSVNIAQSGRVPFPLRKSNWEALSSQKGLIYTHVSMSARGWAEAGSGAAHFCGLDILDLSAWVLVSFCQALRSATSLVFRSTSSFSSSHKRRRLFTSRAEPCPPHSPPLKSRIPGRPAAFGVAVSLVKYSPSCLSPLRWWW